MQSEYVFFLITDIYTSQYYTISYFVERPGIKINVTGASINGMWHNIYEPTWKFLTSDNVYSIRYFERGCKHRAAGPAEVIFCNGKLHVVCYYNNDKLHNEHGSAFIKYNPDGTICEEINYINGKLQT